MHGRLNLPLMMKGNKAMHERPASGSFRVKVVIDRND
jgi:hypothetical protein